MAAPSKRLRNPALSVLNMLRERKRPRTSEISDFLATPLYRLVDRHRVILEKIKTRKDAEYWGHMLIGEKYPEIPSSRAASGKLAALVGLTDYMDFYCAWGYYDLLKRGRTLEEARRILGERMARGIKQFARSLGTMKRRKREIHPRVAADGEI